MDSRRAMNTFCIASSTSCERRPLRRAMRETVTVRRAGASGTRTLLDVCPATRSRNTCSLGQAHRPNCQTLDVSTRNPCARQPLPLAAPRRALERRVRRRVGGVLQVGDGQSRVRGLLFFHVRRVALTYLLRRFIDIPVTTARRRLRAAQPIQAGCSFVTRHDQSPLVDLFSGIAHAGRNHARRARSAREQAREPDPARQNAPARRTATHETVTAARARALARAGFVLRAPSSTPARFLRFAIFWSREEKRLQLRSR